MPFNCTIIANLHSITEFRCKLILWLYYYFYCLERTAGKCSPLEQSPDLSIQKCSVSIVVVRLMYTILQHFGARDYLKEVPQHKIHACLEECSPRGPYPCDNSVFKMCCVAMTEKSLSTSSPEEAVELYMFLCDCIHTQL